MDDVQNTDPLTSKGKHIFPHQGHMFCFHKELADDVKRWRCLHYDRLKCKAAIKLFGPDGNEAVVGQLHQHSHPADATVAEVYKGHTALKRLATNSQESTCRVLQRITAQISVAAKGQFGRDNTVKKTIRRARNDADEAPANPADLAELIIPDRYITYQAEAGQAERFLLYDSGPGADRILIFGRERNLRLLAAAVEIFCDGTFDFRPSMFHQLYSLHIKVFETVQPMIFALLPDKWQATYVRLFTELRAMAPEMNPQHVMTDFELAAINAFSQVFPDAQQGCCLFHFTQNHQRKLSSREIGLGQRYETDAAFALKCRMVTALAFVPIPDVADAFERLEDMLQEPALQPWLNYFEDTYIGRIRRNARVVPMFPIRMWNVYDRVVALMARTNNSVEAWHRALQFLLQQIHPTIWKHIDGLRALQQKSDYTVEQMVAGQHPEPTRKEYRLLNERIERIVGRYHEVDLEFYLRGLAHNLTY